MWITLQRGSAPDTGEAARMCFVAPKRDHVQAFPLSEFQILTRELGSRENRDLFFFSNTDAAGEKSQLHARTSL